VANPFEDMVKPEGRYCDPKVAEGIGDDPKGHEQKDAQLRQEGVRIVFDASGRV
jgi:hypothetical protein